MISNKNLRAHRISGFEAGPRLIVTGGAQQAALDLPDDVIVGVFERYARAHRMLCGGDE